MRSTAAQPIDALPPDRAPSGSSASARELPAQLPAQLLRPNDDVATALADLPAGTLLHLRSGLVSREISLQQDLRTGHKFAVRALASGLRVRKYGEFIGRTTQAVAAGEWVHVHNLETNARHGGRQEQAWYESAEMPVELQVLGDVRCCVGESPLYDESLDRIFWIDVRGTPAIHAISLPNGAQASWPMPEDVGSIALAGDNRLLVALRSGFAWFDCTSGEVSGILDPEPGLPLNRLNDGRCDAAGRYWCGSMNPESGTADGNLYRLDRNLRCVRILDDLLTPNGMNWSPDGSTMYLADTRRGLIYAYPFDAASGTLGQRRVFADVGAMPGGPDGATIDAEGCLWWAHFEGGCLVRYLPDGAISRVIRLPVTKPTACGFGGPGYRRLYVTTATRGLSEEDLQAEPLAGRLLSIDVGVAGMPPVPFLPDPLPERRAP